jgi:hypothetical protein
VIWKDEAASPAVTRNNAAGASRLMYGDAIPAMVNGTFPERLNWEKFAGPTWSTRSYCPAGHSVPLHYPIEIEQFLHLARHSLE